MRWTLYLGAAPLRALWLPFTILIVSSCSTPGMHLPSRYPDVAEAEESEDDGDPIADVKTADVASVSSSPIMAASVAGDIDPDARASTTALISALDDRVHAWFLLLSGADFEGAARMTGGAGTASAIRYWWEAMADDRGRLESLQVLRIEGSGSYYTVDVMCDFDQGLASQVQLMIRDTRDVVSWKRTAQSGPSTSEDAAARS